jgi:hypothetical protein
MAANADYLSVNMNIETAPEMKKETFKGYKARLADGSIVWVINRNDNATLKATGETMPALKVMKQHIAGWQGWSGGARPVYTYGAPYWIRADKVKAL